MRDTKPTEAPELAAKTQKLPAINPPPPEDSEEFRAQQDEVRQMIAANAPLRDILSKLVLMIEAQTPDMVASILLISQDGNHVRHAVAPSLPESYLKAIDGSPIGPKQGSCGTAMFLGRPVSVSDILTDPLWDDYRDYATAIGMLASFARGQNVAFLVGLAFAVAASANLPTILFSLYWKRFTTSGAVTGILVGLFGSLLLVVVGPNVMGPKGLMFKGSDPLFPLENPGIVSIPLGFLAAWLGTIMSREPASEEMYEELRVRALTGLGAEEAEVVAAPAPARPAR